MEDFSSRLAQAAVDAQTKESEQASERQSAHQMVNHQLGTVSTRFQQAATATKGLLQAELETSRGKSVHPGSTLAWTRIPPRHLRISPHQVGGYLLWELVGNFNQLDILDRSRYFRREVIRASDLTPNTLDALILALLDQEAWGEGHVPDVELPESIAIIE